MTREEFKQLPEGPPYYEFEYGEIIEMARAKPKHNRLMGRLFALLDAFVSSHHYGMVFQDSEVDFTPEITYAPDLPFIRIGDDLRPGLGEARVERASGSDGRGWIRVGIEV